MGFLRLVIIVVCAGLLGCGPGSDDDKVVGEWTGQFIQNDGKTRPGANLSFGKEHHFREVFNNLVVEGSWSMSGKTVTLQSELLGGKSVAEMKARLLERAGKSTNPAALRSMAENLAKPMTAILAEDGKTMATPYDGLASGYSVYTKK